MTKNTAGSFYGSTYKNITVDIHYTVIKIIQIYYIIFL